MKILIAGCGKVGETLVQELSDEGHDLTLMDSDAGVLEAGTDRYDVMTVQGNCASAKSLRRAGVEKADLLIACTGSDELNLLSCMTAYRINPHLQTIARIRNPEYNEQIYEMRDTFALSMAFNPEREAAVEIFRLLKFPGFRKRDPFANGRVEIVEIRIDAGSKLCNVPLNTLYGIVRCKVLVCAVLRNGVAVSPNGQFELKENDRIFVTASSEDLSNLLKSLGIVRHKVRRVMIAGGGTLTYYLADLLQNSQIDVSVIDSDRTRCEQLAAAFPRLDVLHGSVRDRDLLESEGFASCDALLSLTASDEKNMVLSLYGDRRQIPQIITKLNDMEDSAIIDALPLGSVVAPHRLCCNNIVRFVRSMQSRGGAVTMHTIADGQVEALEFCIDHETEHCNEPLRRLRLKPNILLACIARGDGVIIPNGDSSYRAGDRVVVVVGQDRVIRQFNDIFE